MRPQGTQDSPLLGNPQIGFSNQGSRGQKHRRTATPSLSALDAAVRADGSLFEWSGQSSKRRRPSPRWRLKGSSIKLSKDYTGISWAFNSCRTGQRTGPLVLTPPTLTLWLTGVRASSAATPHVNHWPLCPWDLLRPAGPCSLLRLSECSCLGSLCSDALVRCPQPPWCPSPL